MADLEGGKGRGVGKDRDEKAESAAPAPAKSPSQLKLVIFGAVALFVALVGAQVAAPLINATIAGSHAEDAEGAEGEELLAEAEEEEIIEEEPIVEEEPEEEEAIAPAIYTALDPPFVVSFDAEDGARYLQLTLQAMARDEETIAAVKQHAPAIRNSVLFMLSGYELEVLATQAGKEELRKSLLGATNEILAKNGVESPVEELYFTSLVIQ